MPLGGVERLQKTWLSPGERGARLVLNGIPYSPCAPMHQERPSRSARNIQNAFWTRTRPAQTSIPAATRCNRCTSGSKGGVRAIPEQEAPVPSNATPQGWQGQRTQADSTRKSDGWGQNRTHQAALDETFASTFAFLGPVVQLLHSAALRNLKSCCTIENFPRKVKGGGTVGAIFWPFRGCF